MRYPSGRELPTMADLTTHTEQLLKPTATIHVGNKLSLIERKVFNAIIWHSQKGRFAKNDNSVSVSLLMSLIGLERSKNIEVIKEALEQLTTTPIIWNTLNKDRTTDWGICTFLAGAELSGGQLRYVLNPLLIEKVRHPTLFAKIQLLIQTQFSSKYSLALYEFLLDELCRAGNPMTHAVQVALDTVRHILQFDGAYKHLNSDVLKPCVREINKHADIAVSYRSVKKGRAVDAILFTVERTAVQVTMPLEDLAVQNERDVEAILPNNGLVALLIERGVGKRKAVHLVDRYDEGRIRENIEYAEKEYHAGKVKNLSAYLIRAIEEDYRPKKTTEELRQEEEAAKERARQAEREALEEEQREWERYRERRVRERFAQLSVEDQETRRAQFAARLKTTNPLIYKQFKKDGFNSRLVLTEFFADMRDEFLTAPEERSFDAYRTRREETVR
jgi:hypothetical protein